MINLKEALKENAAEYQETRNKEIQIFNPDAVREMWQVILTEGSNTLLSDWDKQVGERIDHIETLINLHIPEIVEFWLDLMQEGLQVTKEALQESFRGPLLKKRTLKFEARAVDDMIVVYAKTEGMRKLPMFVIASWTEEEVIYFFRDPVDQKLMRRYYQSLERNDEFSEDLGSITHQAQIFADFIIHLLTEYDPAHSPEILTINPADMRDRGSFDADSTHLRAWEIINRDLN